MAPATKYGGKIVACQPGMMPIEKSKLMTEWTDSTSGVARPASSRYAFSYPHQCRAELRPNPQRVRIGHQPVRRHPGPAGVEEREQRGAGHREERHGLGEPVDRRPPLLVEQQQDRRVERA